jgi:hypothetical protein
VSIPRASVRVEGYAHTYITRTVCRSSSSQHLYMYSHVSIFEFTKDRDESNEPWRVFEKTQTDFQKIFSTIRCHHPNSFWVELHAC